MTTVRFVRLTLLGSFRMLWLDDPEPLRVVLRTLRGLEPAPPPSPSAPPVPPLPEAPPDAPTVAPGTCTEYPLRRFDATLKTHVFNEPCGLSAESAARSRMSTRR